MDSGEDRRSIWQRLPRGAYWALGAVIAFFGAYIARVLGDRVPLDDRIPYWFAGSVFIFVGLWIVSMGTKSRSRKTGSQRWRDEK